MEKNNFEHCIESVDKVRNIVENIKIQLLNENKKEDIGIFTIVDDLCKALGHAAHWAEQLKLEIERKNINENISTSN